MCIYVYRDMLRSKEIMENHVDKDMDIVIDQEMDNVTMYIMGFMV